MKYIFTSITLMLSYYLHAQDANLVWAKSIGGTLNDIGRSIAIDVAGNVYTTGVFQGTEDFDPGPGVVNLTSVGGSDIFISKLDASGNFVWAKNIGGSSDDNGYSIAVDASGNVFTSGFFSGTADFDPGPGVFNLTSVGHFDIFISKLDASGNFVWAKTIGGTLNDEGRDLSLDASGNLYITGYFQGTADFAPGPGVVELTSAGGTDIFILKLDASGNFVWAKRIGGPYNAISDISYSITVDPSGNVYTTGGFWGTADFDPGPGISNLTSAGTAGFYDIFVSKLDASGNFVWAKGMGGTSDDQGFSVAVDASGNVYTTGFFYTTADFDPGPGTYELTSAGTHDIFVSKLDASGNFVWAKSIGGTSEDLSYSLWIDALGNVYTTGFFNGTVDFDPGPGTRNLTSAGSADIFISKLDASGNFVWAKNMGGASGDFGYSITVDASGNVVTTGSFEGTADFDPGPGMINLTSVGGQDVFVVKLAQAAVLPVTLSRFTVQNNNCTAHLKWTTASEQNSKHFDVQHSTDGMTFTTKGIVAASGNSNVEKQYTFTTVLSDGNNYFRLRTVDIDGSSELSTIVSVPSNCNAHVINLYPNPVKNMVTVTGLNGATQLRVLDNLGQVLTSVKTTNRSETINLSSLPAGTFIVQVVQNGKVMENMKVIKE